MVLDNSGPSVTGAVGPFEHGYERSGEHRLARGPLRLVLQLNLVESDAGPCSQLILLISSRLPQLQHMAPSCDNAQPDLSDLRVYPEPLLTKYGIDSNTLTLMDRGGHALRFSSDSRTNPARW